MVRKPCRLSYRTLIADIDGTLTEKGEPLLPRTREALIRLHEDGLDIGLATGRPLDQRIFDRAKEWNLGFGFDLLIGMNGGELWDRYTEKITREKPLSEDTLAEILSFMTEADVNAIIFAEGYDRVLALREDPILLDSSRRNHSVVEYVTKEVLAEKPACKLEFHYDPAIEEDVYRIIGAHSDPRWTSVRTFGGTVEFMDPSVDKGAALKRFSEHSGIAMEAIIACGDMENDIGMMKAAGLGLCLANGSDAANAAADVITDYPVSEDGLGRFLMKRLYNA